MPSCFYKFCKVLQYVDCKICGKAFCQDFLVIRLYKENTDRRNYKQSKNQLSRSFEKLCLQLFVIWIKIKSINIERFSTTNIHNIESANSSIEKRADVKEIGCCIFTLERFSKRPIVVHVSWLPNVRLANKFVPFYYNILWWRRLVIHKNCTNLRISLNWNINRLSSWLGSSWKFMLPRHRHSDP